MSSLLACGIGFGLDLLFGDPVWLYHPVRLMGKLIAFLEMVVRKIFRASKRGELLAGVCLCLLVITASTGIPWLLLVAVGKIHRYLRFALEAFWCYQILAVKSLSRESMKVYDELKQNSLAGARTAVSMIVGRDTENLDQSGVIKAAVETVAENTSDGVVAPLLYMIIGGVPLGFFYKAVNTMDSMVGYKNERYRYFGRAAAKLDDLCNFIPARIAAVLMIAAAFLTRMNWQHAYYIFCRDRLKHASPNSAQTEAVCAGALEIQLAGAAWYFGVCHQKEVIGDDLRPVEAEDIKRAGTLLYVTAILTLVLFGSLKFFALVLLSGSALFQ